MFPTTLLPTRRTNNWGTPALLAAAGLAASFLYVQAKKKSTEKKNPPAGKFIEVDGVRLHYLERGEGPALVLLHGNGLFADDFELSGLLEQAARTHRVIAFDRPGFGYSARPGNTSWTPEAQARLFYNALHALRVERPIVVAHSLGTQVALSMALDYPRYVRAIALIGGYFYPSARLDSPIASLPAIPVLGQVYRYTVAPLVGRMLWPALVKQMFAPARTEQRFDRLPVWMALRPGQLGAAAAESGMMIPAAARLSKRYAELTMPVALIAGSGDLVADAEYHSVRLHEEVSHSDLTLEDGVGHMAHYAAPERIMAAVAKLESVPG
ncbi:MAG: alpha/beta hydrolase [Massilia sp.]|nr:alpha/beta hydrolase [Massilia sp.]